MAQKGYSRDCAQRNGDPGYSLASGMWEFEECVWTAEKETIEWLAATAGVAREEMRPSPCALFRTLGMA